MFFKKSNPPEDTRLYDAWNEAIQKRFSDLSVSTFSAFSKNQTYTVTDRKSNQIIVITSKGRSSPYVSAEEAIKLFYCIDSKLKLRKSNVRDAAISKLEEANRKAGIPSNE